MLVAGFSSWEDTSSIRPHVVSLAEGPDPWVPINVCSLPEVHQVAQLPPVHVFFSIQASTLVL